jgi:hypothetical protein
VYCIVRVNGSEAARTTIVKDTLDPEWGRGQGESFIVALPVDVMTADLRLEVWDHDNIGADDFLGEVLISPAQILTGMSDEATAEKKPRKAKEPKPGKQAVVTDITAVEKQAGSLVSKIKKNKGKAGGSFGLGAERELAHAHFVRRALQAKQKNAEAKVTNITGVKRQADSLVSKFKKKQEAKAKKLAAENTTTHLGLAAKMEQGEGTADATEGTADATEGGGGTSKGMVPKPGETQKKSKKEKGKKKAIGSKYVKGDLVFEWELLPSDDMHMGDAGEIANATDGELVQLKIHSANGLSADLFGLDIPDAYCKIIWNEREIGRTTVVQDDRAPSWKHEIFEILVKPLELSSSSLRVEVWDEDMASKDDFLGQIILTAEQMLHLPPVGEGDHKLHKRQAQPQENSAAATRHDSGRGRRHSVIGLTDGGYATEFRLRKKADFHGKLGISWGLSDQDAELTTAWRNHPRTWNSIGSSLAAAPAADRGAHPAAADAWTEALTLAGGAAEELELEQTKSDAAPSAAAAEERGAAKKDADGEGADAQKQKQQQARLQNALVSQAVGGFNVGGVVVKSESELAGDDGGSDEHAWSIHGPHGASLYCSLAKELWCCGRRRRARAAAQAAVSVNPWCFEAISLLDQWNPRKLRARSSSSTALTTSMSADDPAATLTSSFGAALAGPLQPWLRRGMRDEDVVVVRLQALFRQKGAMTRSIRIRTALHHLLGELQLCVESATAIQVCFRLWIWKDVVRWYYQSAVHLAAACICRTIRRRGVVNMASIASKIRQDVVQIELVFYRLGRVGWGRKMEETTLAKGRQMLLKQLDEETAKAEEKQRRAEEAKKGAEAAKGKIVSRTRDRYDDEGHLMHPDEMMKKRTKVSHLVSAT